MRKYPLSIRELGGKHRREAGYKYIELPRLYDALVLNRKIWLAYQEFYSKFGEEIALGPARDLLNEVQNDFYRAWLNYFGEEAQKELQALHNMTIFEMERKMNALITMIYEYNEKDSYTHTNVYINGECISFDSKDKNPASDYNAALDYACNAMVDEIQLADATLLFPMYSKGAYLFDLKDRLVKVERG